MQPPRPGQARGARARGVSCAPAAAPGCGVGRGGGVGKRGWRAVARGGGSSVQPAQSAPPHSPCPHSHSPPCVCGGEMPVLLLLGVGAERTAQRALTRVALWVCPGPQALGVVGAGVVAQGNGGAVGAGSAGPRATPTPAPSSAEVCTRGGTRTHTHTDRREGTRSLEHRAAPCDATGWPWRVCVACKGVGGGEEPGLWGEWAGTYT